MKSIKWFMKEGLLVKDNSFKLIYNKFLEKARNNLITMNLLAEMDKNKQTKDILKLPKDYNADEWIVITGYYSMYSSALALLAKIGFKSKNHTATILVLEEFFIKKNLLNQEDLILLKNASLKKEELRELSEARQKREIAQYSITKQTTREIAEKISKDAKNFVNKCEEILIKINKK